MDTWDFQPLNADELELRDALLALERVLDHDSVAPVTRLLLGGAATALRGELA